MKVWQAHVGHVRLYLLDTDLEENTPEDRDIAHQLYGGDRTPRIKQEIVLGVGGVRALQELGIKPTVWHINEGHAAFLILERMRTLMVQQGLDFASALEAVAANTVFTTHTPVPAGHDHFSEDMICRLFPAVLPRHAVAPRPLVFPGRDAGKPGIQHDRAGDARLAPPQRREPDSRRGFLAHSVPRCGRKCCRKRTRCPTSPTACMCRLSWRRNGSDLFDNVFGYEWRHRMSDPEFWNRIERNSGPAVLERAPVAQVADAATGALPHERSSISAITAAKPISTGCSSTSIVSTPTC